MMKDLKMRFLTSLIGIGVVACILYFAYHPLFRYLVVAAVALLSSVAIWEYGKAVRNKGFRLQRGLLEMGSFLLVASCFFFENLEGMLPFIVLFVLILLAFFLHFRDSLGAIADISVLTFGYLYISLPLGLLVSLIYFPWNGEEGSGRIWVIYLLLVTKVSDMGAYFVGKVLGRRKLARVVSPNKTLEGAIGGLLTSLLISLAFFLLFYNEMGLSSPSFFLSASLSVLLAIAGQVGDLAESLLKRDASIKDSNAIPGLGGILDSVDSLLCTLPLLYFYLHLRG